MPSEEFREFKLRPGLIVSKNSNNQRLDDVIIMNQDASGRRSGDKDCGAEALAMLCMAGLRMLIAALVLAGLAQAAQAGDRPMYRHDAPRTGAADEVVEPLLELLWNYGYQEDLRGEE